MTLRLEKRSAQGKKVLKLKGQKFWREGRRFGTRGRRLLGREEIYIV
jgi:hypothetical protein